MTPGKGPDATNWGADPEPGPPWPPVQSPGVQGSSRPGHDPFGSATPFPTPAGPASHPLRGQNVAPPEGVGSGGVGPGAPPFGPAGGVGGGPAGPTEPPFPFGPSAEVRGGAPPTSTGGATGPPTWMLVGGVIVPLLTLPLLLVSSVPINFLGWGIAIFGSLGFLTAFTVVDLRRRVSRWYVDRPGLLAGLRISAIVAGVVIAGCHAYLIADEIARWDQWVS